jgi:hypothetical protein
VNWQKPALIAMGNVHLIIEKQPLGVVSQIQE